MLAGKPIVALRKHIIIKAEPYYVNKLSYEKPGSQIFNKRTEEHLFDNMFEILLAEDYEDNWEYRNQERAEINGNIRVNF